MEPRETETLASLLRRGPLDVDTALRYAADIGAALDAAHARGIVHGDVRPAAVTITPSGALLRERAAAAQAGGSPPDARADVYAFGATCYEMLTGCAPSTVPPQPSRLNPAVPSAIDAIILRCLSARPDERPRIRAALNALTVSLSEGEAARATMPWRYAAAAAAMLAIVVAAGCPN